MSIEIDTMSPEQMRETLRRVLDLCADADPNGPGIPVNATLLVCTTSGGHQNAPETERVYVRADDLETTEDPALNTPLFYPIGGRVEENTYRASFGELLWLDDPACDRGSVSLEAYLPVGEIVHLISEAAKS